MSIRTKFRLLLPSIFLATYLLSQPDFRFTQFSYQQGIFSNTINDIITDGQGFLWIATPVGAGRYDGQSFKQYHFTIDSTAPAGTGFLSVDARGTLWSGGHRLNYYDPLQDRFVWVRHPREWGFIHATYGDRNGRVWVGMSERGIHCIDIDTRQFIPHPMQRLTEIMDHSITEIIEDHRGRLWFSFPNGLYSYDFGKDSLSKFFLRENLDVGYNDGIVKCLFIDSRERLWIGTTAGLWYHDPDTDQLLPVAGTSNIVINCMEEPIDGLLWIQSGTQIYLLKTGIEGPLLPLLSGSFDLLKGQMITSLHRSTNGDFWLGSMHQGLFHWSKNFKPFKLHKTIFNQVLLDCGLLENTLGEVVIANQTGILIYDPVADLFQADQRLQDLPAGMLAEDRKGWIWVASWNGLYKFNPATGEVILYEPDEKDPNAIPGYSIPVILIDRKDQIWIGAWDKGLYRYREATDDFEMIPVVHRQENRQYGAFYRLLDDRDGNLWIAGGGGIIRLNADYSIDSLYDYRGYDLYEDRAGIIWAATESGLVRIDPSNEELKLWTTREGLANDWVTTILEDDQGYLWLGTRNGLSKFDPASEHFSNFTIEDGLPGKDFSYYAFKSRSKELFFSLRDGGIIHFNPHDIQLNSDIPEIVITQMEVANEPLAFSDKRFNSIYQDAEIKRQINLKWNENDISLNFASLNFVAPQKNRYRYRLKNYDEDWILSDQKRPYSTYTNLDPGRYTFEVQGSNNDDIWSLKTASLGINIVAPWWWNTVSKIFYIIISISLLLYIWTFQKNRQELRHALALEKVKSEKLSELNDLKSHFFTNISHELLTPLTLISGPVKELSKRSRREDKKFIELIENNALQLKQLVNQLLDLSKIDAHQSPLQADEHNLNVFVRRIFELFEPIAAEKNIRYTLFNHDGDLPVFFDADKLEKALLNLLGNAFKFTPGGGKIEVTVSEENQQAKVDVADSGIGIPEDQLPFLFDRFFQVDSSNTRTYQGSGIGLSLVKELINLHHGKVKVTSEEGRGSRFTILLPLGHTHLKEEEIVPQVHWTPSFEEINSGENHQLQIRPVSIPNQGMPTILLVEDHADMRAFVSRILGPDYQILEAPDGVHALGVAREKIPDLVISDVMMPRLSGMEFCHHLKEDILTCHIPVILLTVKADLQSRIAGFKQGANAYINKPFEADELHARINALLKDRKRLQEYYRNRFNGQLPTEKKLDLDPLVTRLHKLVMENLDDPDFGTPQICRKIGISRAQLYRKTRALTGETVGMFINKIRLNHALHLFKTTPMNVSEVAYSVGFRDPAYFSRLFRKLFGKAPSQFR